MKQFSIKIASFTLAFLVLFSTFSFTVDTHFCGDFLVDISFTGEAEGCEMQMGKASEAKMKNCCKDEVQEIEGQKELQIQKAVSLSFKKQQFLTTFIATYKDIFVKSKSNNNFYKDFSPPDIPIDYQVLYQNFLI
ncbi:hypothetical protein [Polaribacter sp.]|uniref:HYC_CC_PP family protein n=1 Tax=Polaribacter sp. TaxID=1920175 RepID=UPI0025E492C5|nr:hypothetical protein [Polaribacter sp.]